MLTLLRTDQQPGLQIWTGGRFLDVPPKPGAFIINLGDMLERCAALAGACKP
jgi:isopenicillin N synthase-like dioxygenase